MKKTVAENFLSHKHLAAKPMTCAKCGGPMDPTTKACRACSKEKTAQAATAQQAFAAAEAETQHLLKGIQRELEWHEVDFEKTGSTDWGFTGSLKEVNNHLGEALAILSGTKAR